VAAPDTPADAARPRVAVGPDTASTPLDAARGDTFEVALPGFYEVRNAGTDGTTASIVAANVDVAESDLASVDPAVVTAAVAGTGEAAVAAGAAAGTPPRDEVTEQSQRLWWYLLLAGMLLLIGETVVASRLSGGAT